MMKQEANAAISVRIVSRPEDLLWHVDRGLVSISRPAHSAIASYLPWYLSWYENFQTEGAMETWLFSRGEAYQGIAPLMRRRERWIGYSCEVLRSASNSQSLYWDLVGHDPDVVLDALCCELKRRSEEWDLVCLSRVPEQSFLVEHGRELSSGYGLRSRTLLIGENRIIPVHTGWDTWTAGNRGLAKALRHQMRLLKKQGDLQFQSIHNTENLEDHLSTFFTIEAAAWKGTVGAAILHHEQQRWFYINLARRAAESGQLALHFLRLDDRVLAGLFCLCIGDTCYFLKTGYDADYRRHSPGNLILFKALEQCFADPAIHYADLGPIHPGDWKERWKGENRKLFEVMLFGSSFAGRSLYHLVGLRQALRRSYPGRLLHSLLAQWRLRKAHRRRRKPQRHRSSP